MNKPRGYQEYTEIAHNLEHDVWYVICGGDLDSAVVAKFNSIDSEGDAAFCDATGTYFLFHAGACEGPGYYRPATDAQLETKEALSIGGEENQDPDDPMLWIDENLYTQDQAKALLVNLAAWTGTKLAE